jgi:hypothetical protein
MCADQMVGIEYNHHYYYTIAVAAVAYQSMSKSSLYTNDIDDEMASSSLLKKINNGIYEWIGMHTHCLVVRDQVRIR